MRLLSPAHSLERLDVVGRGELKVLFTLWFDLDAEAALDQLVEWVIVERVQVGEKWVLEGVLLALGSDDRKTARRARENFAEDAERRRDPETLVSLVESGRDAMRPADWRSVAIQWLQDATAIASDEATLDRCAALVLDILRELHTAGDDDPAHILAVVLERRVSDHWATALRAELVRLRPKEISP